MVTIVVTLEIEQNLLKGKVGDLRDEEKPARRDRGLETQICLG